MKAFLIILLGLTGFTNRSHKTKVNLINRLNPTSMNETIIYNDHRHGFSSQTTYMGYFLLKNNRYQVYKMFSMIQAAISKHGNSFIYITKDRKIIRTFHLDMPYELPLALTDNKFQYEHETVPLIENNKLIDALCTEEYGCYFSEEFMNE